MRPTVACSNHSQAVDPRGMENSGPAAKLMRRLVVLPCQFHGHGPNRLAAAQPETATSQNHRSAAGVESFGAPSTQGLR